MGRIAAKTGARLARTLNARVERGAGRVAVDFLLPGRRCPLQPRRRASPRAVGCRSAGRFFACLDKPSEHAEPATMRDPHARHAQRGHRGGLKRSPKSSARCRIAPSRHEKRPTTLGEEITPEAAAAVGTLLPEGAIVVDAGAHRRFGFHRGCGACLTTTCRSPAARSVSGRRSLPERRSPPIDQRDPAQADGSAMYTVQALWTQARESLDVTTVLLDNRSYAILKHELANVGAGDAGRRALDMMELDRSALDWVDLARGMGIEADAPRR